MDLQQLKQARNYIKDQESRLGSEKINIRKLIIKKFKEAKNREPTEEEIQLDINYIAKIKLKLKDKTIIPIIGPYEKKKKNVL